MPPSLEQQRDRQAQHRLAVLRHAEEVTGNVALTCRYYGISRTCFYKWLRRYQDEGLEGLRDRSSKPHHCPHATEADVINKIVYLRQHYHFGPMKIKMYLKRYHDIDIACSAVYRILKKLGMNRLPASQRYQRHDKRYTRYEKQLPGNRVQIDVKFIEPIGLPEQTAAAAPVTGTLPKRRRRAKYYQFTAIDDCTRLRVLRIYPRCDQKTAVQFVERSHRIDAEEFYRMLDGILIDDTGVFNDKLRKWEDYYNYHRPHGALGGQTPYERLKQKTQTPL
ncbi:helix-turn-helix domain-containing protein [Streptomyces sp. TLI_105]|uniref:helix-turn-helix domain-containing protein n=1 Tax=Streptomyces sp. TLI_105 TaxID=1881019 RepID=UPI00089B580F|nr:helix-turn-helix domain-containing protein [Streptomyces sp. TLI_105]SED92699.1 Transposase [Streptomyces sp. TLI_105]